MSEWIAITGLFIIVFVLSFKIAKLTERVYDLEDNKLDKFI